MAAYHQNPSIVAITSALCITAVLIEGLWNGLCVSLTERLAVVMPTVINVGAMTRGSVRDI